MTKKAKRRSLISAIRYQGMPRNVPARKAVIRALVTEQVEAIPVRITVPRCDTRAQKNA